MKKITILYLICILSVLNIRAEVYSGSCGDNVNYSLDTSTGVLSITGSGAMTNYTFSSYTDVPWYSNKSYIKKVEISDGVTTIGDWNFYDCSDLISINIPNSVTSLGKMAFYNCSHLPSIELTNSVTEIGKETFRNCCSLTEFTIPSSVETVGFNAFSMCYFEKNGFINNSTLNAEANKYWGATIVDSRENGFVIKDNTLIIYTGNETSVTIPNSVTIIGKLAFQYCPGLTSVTIGSGIKTINEKAFADCHELTDVYCYAENVPNTMSDAFVGSPVENATLHVPASAIEQYKATTPWSQFGTTESTEGNTPEPPTPNQCAKPTISYDNGNLTFDCETEGADFVSEITDTDIKKHYDKSISLTATYTICVYATKAGYGNSEVATATLCWIDAQPAMEGISEDAIAEVKAVPVLIQTQGGTISIQGAAEGTPIAVYDVDGRQHGTGFAEKGCAGIDTSLRAGSVAIVKIGEKSVKVIIK